MRRGSLEKLNIKRMELMGNRFVIAHEGCEDIPSGSESVRCCIIPDTLNNASDWYFTQWGYGVIILSNQPDVNWFKAKIKELAHLETIFVFADLNPRDHDSEILELIYSTKKIEAVFLLEKQDPYLKTRINTVEFIGGDDSGYRVVEIENGRIYHEWIPSQEPKNKYMVKPWDSLIRKRRRQTIRPKSYRQIGPKGMFALIDMMEYIEEHSYRPISEFEGVEIGTYQGGAAEVFARKFKNLVTVDPWMRPSGPMTSVEAVYMENMAEYKNVSHMKLSGVDACGWFPDGSTDFVYIDADHCYKPVKIDVEMWMPKLKPDGWLCGHDYRGQGTANGVEQALIDTVGQPDKVFPDKSWVIKFKGGSRG